VSIFPKFHKDWAKFDDSLLGHSIFKIEFLIKLRLYQILKFYHYFFHFSYFDPINGYQFGCWYCNQNQGLVFLKSPLDAASYSGISFLIFQSIYYNLPNNHEANLINFLKNSKLHTLIPTCMFISLWRYQAKTLIFP